MRGVSVSIFRPDDFGDCSNNGVTSPRRAKGVYFVVFDEALSEGNYSLEECAKDPRFVCLKLVRRWVGTENEYIHAEPMFENGGLCSSGHKMFGGNYVFTSDSRLRRVNQYPIPVHDRIE